MAYTARVPKSTSARSAAINRGMKFFLVGLIENGETWFYDGNDIEAYLKQIQSRRKSYQHDSKASGRSGHGRKRILRPAEKLEAKGQRWRETKCQTVARRFVDWLAKRNIGRLYIEDFSGIRNGPEEALEGGKYVWDRIQEWPYYQLEMRLISCAEEAGIQVIKVDAHKISKTCPKCGSPADADLRHWKINCPQCGFRRHLDVAAAMNVMARGKVKAAKQFKDSSGLDTKQKAGKRTARKNGRNGANGKAK
jgi:IS605 OrfB family transposase